MRRSKTRISHSREAAPKFSPGRKPWVGIELDASPEKAQETLPQTCGNIVAHLIFSTKGREPLIRPEIRADLVAYLGDIIREMRGTALIINGTADHVHVLARIRPAHSAAQIARVIKTNSSRWYTKKDTLSSPGRPDMAYSASANRTLDRSRSILRLRKHITRSIRSKKNS